MPAFSSNKDLHAYLTQLILPTHLRRDGEKITQDIMSGYNTTGISVAVLPPTSNAEEYSKAPILTSTFGLRDFTDSASAIDPETTFQAASISKPFTALAVLRLAVQEKLNLDVDIEEYLALDKNIRRTTSPSARSRSRARDVLLGRRHNRRAAHPDARHRKAFPVLMHELVLEPLGMTRSTYEQPIDGGQAARVNYAKAHHTAYTGFTAGTECMIHPEMAAGGLWTTPSDLLRASAALVAEAFTETNGFGGYGIGWTSVTLSTDESGGKRRVVLGMRFEPGFQCTSRSWAIPLVGAHRPSRPKPPVGIAWMTNSDDGSSLAGGSPPHSDGWLAAAEVGSPVSVQANLRLAGVGGRVADEGGGDVALHGPHVSVTISEKEGLPIMSTSVLSDPATPLVLLPAAFNHKDAIVWLVRDMNVAVAMKEGDEKPPIRSLEIWQNETAYEAEKV
ncbi:beta-lactamase/transpeptidase-like protein [Mycena leptocephala]|nr:beta-lactamase/transpeptidase-like protein [Mycena leptocephala]